MQLREPLLQKLGIDREDVDAGPRSIMKQDKVELLQVRLIIAHLFDCYVVLEG